MSQLEPMSALISWSKNCRPTLAALVLAASAARGADTAADAACRGDREGLRSLLAAGADLDGRDAGGNTALHWAALHGDAALVAELLERGAAADAPNASGAAPLLYAVGNLDSVRALVARSANVNRVSKFHTSPLMAAARYPESHAVVRFLLEHGADAKIENPFKADALASAAYAGDLAAYQLLLEAGAKPNDVIEPAKMGHRAIVEAALAAGIDPNVNGGFAGHALNHALYGQSLDIAKLLIERGADLRLRSPEGEHHTPPMLWAAYNESGDVSVARLMIAKGADPNMPSARGDTALDWARARGNRALEKVLLEAGARESPVGRKRKEIPDRELPADREALDSLIRRSIATAIERLQKSSDAFLRSGVVKAQACVSCHQQTLPAMAYAWARRRGVAVDESSIARQVQEQVRFWKGRNKIEKTYEMIRPQPDAPVLLGYGLLGLSALGYPADALTDAMVWYLAATQRPDGSWPAADYRPPMEDGPIQGAAFALRALQLYPLAARRDEMRGRIEHARDYLARSSPVSFNQQVFRLLGLAWAGESGEALRPYAARILEKQGSDGGWAQLDGLQSDAWATGQALVALQEAGSLTVSDPAFERAIRFLLRTQFDDGSWYVRSRAWPFQPHFESEFPHGKDQWISAGGTAWAVMALLLTLPEKPGVTAVDWLAIRIPASQTTSGQAAAPREEPPARPREIDFARDIEPLLARSCAACHGGGKKRGSFSIESRESLLAGGQSREPVVVPGRSEASRLLRMVTGRIEDLEMPPLSKRGEYPALSADEVALLGAWIDGGLSWKAASSQ